MAESKNNQKKEKTTKERIFEASIDLFAQKGFDATSMRDIAAKVGIKQPSMYGHFKSKDEILEKIVEYPISTILALRKQDQGTEKLIATMGLEGFMDSVSEGLISWLEDPYMEKIFRIIHIELYHNPQAKKFYSELLDTAYSYWESNFSIMINQRLIKPIDPKILAMEFISFFQNEFTDYFLVKYGSKSGSFRQESHDRLNQHVQFIMDLVKLQDDSHE